MTTEPMSEAYSKEALELWADLCERDDRTSPEEYPGWALIRQDVFCSTLDRFRAAGAQSNRLPRGWMFEMRRYYNLPDADCGYAKVWSPHIDDPPVEVYARTPELALQQAIDKILAPR